MPESFRMSLAVLAAATWLAASLDSNAQAVPQRAPEFTHASASEWINSRPLTLADLRGRVVLVDFWTFDCWNCYRSFPWLHDLEARLATQHFTVLGVHSPEFEHERDRKRVEAKVREFELRHPVMIDNDFSYWRALGNRYWPAFYVIDKQGRIRGSFAGETHAGDRARAVEALIRQLLAEPAPPTAPSPDSPPPGTPPE